MRYRHMYVLDHINRAVYARSPLLPGLGLGVSDASPAPVRERAEKMDQKLEICTVRSQLGRHMRVGHATARRLLQLVAAVYVLNAVLSLGFVGTGLTGEVFAISSSNHLINRRTKSGRALTNWARGDNSTSRGTKWAKVVVVVLDGMRNDYFAGTRTHPEVTTLLSDYEADLIHMPLQCSLPSMSVPNWLTLLTGAPPELTGAMGNVNIPETWFDSIFRRVKIAQRAGALTGSPWFADIVTSVIVDHGDMQGSPDMPKGTVPTTYNTTVDNAGMTAKLADEKRAELALAAIASGVYDLFLVHFSDIDGQGHSFGVTDEYNTESVHGSWIHLGDSYNSAIADKMRLLRRIMEVVDEDTIVAVTADHGHVDAGGHGGVANEVLEVPLMLYRRGSGVGLSTTSAPPQLSDLGATADLISNVEFASMISALLGLPIPAHSTGFGRLLPTAQMMLSPLTAGADADIIHRRDEHLQVLFEDLLEQQLDFAAQLASELSKVPPTVPAPHQSDWKTLANYAAQHHSSWVELKHSDYNAMTVMNLVTALVISGLLLLLGFTIREEHTPCIPTLLLPHGCCKKPTHSKWHQVRAIFSPRTNTSNWEQQIVAIESNRLAACASACLVAGYFCTMILAFLVSISLQGYSWDSTLIHNIGRPIYVYLFVTMGLGLVIQAVIFKLGVSVLKLWLADRLHLNRLRSGNSYWFDTQKDTSGQQFHHGSPTFVQEKLIRVCWAQTTASVHLNCRDPDPGSGSLHTRNGR